jgi:UDP-N-acetylmuramoyl-tripeptide--D-alanyl-D-alanine ligase
MSEQAKTTWKMNLDELIRGTGGKALSQAEKEYSGIGTDTRAALSHKIFFALKGDSFDAHDYLAQAVQSGAAALVVHRKTPELEKILKSVTVIEVDDTLKALQRLANFWRRGFKARVVGITGTNGKTTCKEFTAAILGTKFSVQYSKGSFNNHWGVPISLLSVCPEHQVAVVEMGMNHPGELKDLARIVEADAIVCTMVGRGHLEGVGSIEGVALAKEEIYLYSPAKATRIFNLDNQYTRAMYDRCNQQAGPVLTFAAPGGTKADVSLKVESAGVESLTISGEIRGISGRAEIPVFGRHNVTNLMAASCLALDCGMAPAEIWRALPFCQNTWGRNQWVRLESRARVLFDAYNANPESMKAALENFAALSTPTQGRKIAVLGEMRELGTQAPALHQELGRLAAQCGFDLIWFIGPSQADFAAGLKAGGFSKKSINSASYELNLASQTLPVLDEYDLVLIKGSRGVQLEKVLNELKPVGFQNKK